MSAWEPIQKVINQEWHETFGPDIQPNEKQITDFIHNPVWDSMNDYLRRAYTVEPKYSYSGCSMQPGWNVKYSKSGKSLCTMYPMDGYFTSLIVVGPKEMTEAELMMPYLTDDIRKIFTETKIGQGAKWLMLGITNRETLADALKLIALRLKPNKHIEMED